MTPEARFRQLLTQHQRIAIAGVPGAGKTTLSKLVTDRPVIHTDDYIKDSRGRDDWDGCPTRCCVAIPMRRQPVVLEGVRATAVLQLMPELHFELHDPFTCLIWLDQPHPSVKYTPEQERAAKGRRTNFAKWLRENAGRIEVVRL